MTDHITRGKDVGGATGAGNDGSFATKGQSPAEVELTPVASTPMQDRFLAAFEAEYAANRRTLALAESALRENLLSAYPNAATAAFAWSDDEEAAGLEFQYLLDANGDEIPDSQFYGGAHGITPTFDDYVYLRNLPAFNALGHPITFDLTAPTPEQTIAEKLATINAELDEAQPIREALAAREGALAVNALTAIARSKFPDAAALLIQVLRGGGAHYAVGRVVNAEGETLWNYDDGDDNLADTFAEYAPLLDNARDRLVPAGRDDFLGWKLTL